MGVEMWMDTHCHLDPETYGGDDGVDAVIARAREAGVTRMTTIGAGYGAQTFARAAAVADRHADVWFTAGVHPHDASRLDGTVLAVLASALDHPKLVALGEIGLDFHYDLSERDVQREAFRTQIRLARQRGLPIVIHDRSSGGETLRILDDEGAFSGRVLYHCFSGDRQEADAIVERGGYLSIPGIVTFKTADEMRAVAAAVPEDRLLVETDSPFLAPVPFRGKRNEPAHTAVVGSFVATLRGVDPATLAAQTTANALRFYGITST
jgi:TatD DNase family protein